MIPKIIIIGLDGATFDIIKPMVKRGWLPNIAMLMRSGVYGKLESTIHPITPQAWSTFLTGKNAGKHGIFDFIRRKEGSYDIEFINASHRNGESMFLYLSRQGLRVGTIAIPFTYPPEPVNGFMLSGLDAPAEDERAVYPKEIFEEICKRFGNYYIHLASPVGRTLNEDKFWEDIQTEDRNRTDVSLYLMEHHPCDLLMTMYNNTDRVQHQYLTYKFLEDIHSGDSEHVRMNLIAKVYENTDQEIGRILDKIHKDTLVILMSDHGSGPIRRVFFLNRWLQEHGFLSYRQKSHMGFHIVENARYLSKRLLPRWAKGFIKGFFPQVRDRVESYRYFSEIDWGKSIAYGFGTYGNIYINLKGREPHGIVPTEDFDRICYKITEKLLELMDPDTGAKLIKQVYRKEDLYHGLCSTQAPDLIIGWQDYEYYTSTSPGRESGSHFGKFLKIDSSDFNHVGTHRLNGIFIAEGKNVKQGNVLEGAHIADIAPTILFALGYPIPDEMDGKVLFDIFTGDFLKGYPPKYVSLGEKTLIGSNHVDYTAEESKEVEERLKGLGYL
jgi:predicted AlkP superfamily phosphohydrolase/phosphomutase